MIPYIQSHMVEDRLDWMALVNALAAGHAGARAQMKDQLITRDDDALLSRAAWVDGQGMAVKSVSVMPANTARDMPTVQGALLLFDDETGAIEAVIDSALVTKWKTAGDSILGAKLLARPQSERLLVVGAGTVAASLIDAYRALFPEVKVSVWNRNPARAEDLANSHNATAVIDLAGAVGRADIITVATLSKVPLIKGDWLRDGQHLDLIGAYRADMREADDTALLRSKIFVDCIDTTIDHIGELKTPLAEGVITRADILGDFYDLVGNRIGRRAPSDITLFKNGGGAHLDLMTARLILKTYKEVSNTAA